MSDTLDFAGGRITHLSKGAGTTTTVWSLHLVGANSKHASLNSRDAGQAIFTSQAMHASVVLAWLSTLCFRGAHLSNFILWSSNPFETSPAGNVPTPPLGQALPNAGDDGQHIFAGAFFAWRSVGLLTQDALKSLALLCVSLSALGLLAGYLHAHKVNQPFSRAAGLPCFAGAGVLGWAGHLTHVCLPQQSLLAAGVDVGKLPTPLDAAARMAVWLDVPELTAGYDGAVSTELTAAHHLSLGTLSLAVFLARQQALNFAAPFAGSLYGSSLLCLAIALGCAGSLSIAVCFALPFAPSYGAVASSYATMWGLFCHHYWVGILSLAGAGSHLALFAVRSTASQYPPGRETVIGHLTWARAFLGVHSVGALMHNDSMEALGRNHDRLSDGSIQVRPMILKAAQSLVDPALQRLGSADFLVAHVESFCIHTAVLVLLKGWLVSRSSRLVPDKAVLGFTYPCDGPGRGGTCQISPWDHVFLGSLWAYNAGSVGPFHWFWYAQSFKWAQLDDWAVSAGSVNGWLRSLLWTQSVAVIQAYGTAFSGYSLVFLTGHFVWALSLMFLFTGRGYWQELVESVAWAHGKVHLAPTIQPRALSITTGRAVGLTHSLGGGVAASWAFETCRLVF